MPNKQQKNIMQHIKRGSTILVSLIIGLCLVWPAPAYAAQGTIFFNPTVDRKDPGSTFSVEVRTSVQNPNSFLDLTGGATVGVTYPTALLQATAVSTTGSLMGGTASIAQSSGTISYSAFNSPPRYGTNQLLFTITFKAVGTGSAGLNFSSTTKVNSGPTTPQAATITIAPAPVATCPAGQVGTPPNCSAAASTPTPSTTAPQPQTTTAPATEAIPDVVPEAADAHTEAGDLSIQNVTVKTGWKATTINWAPSLPDVTNTLSLGTSKNNLKPRTDITPEDDKTFTATFDDLLPGTRYYYAISSAPTADPDKKASYTGAFTTKGYPVKLVFNHDSSPIVGAKVTIDTATYTTDKNGAVEVTLADKSYEVPIVTADAITQKVRFTVAKKSIPTDGSDPKTQVFTFAIAPPSGEGAGSTFPIGVVAATIAAGIALMGLVAGFLVYRRKKTDEAALPAPTPETYPWDQPMQATESSPYVEMSSEDMGTPQETPAFSVPEQQIYSEQPQDMWQEAAQATFVAAPADPSPEPTIPQQASADESLTPAAEVPAMLHDTSTDISSSPAYEQQPTDATDAVVHDEETASGDTDAIYDPQTGELAIIHQPRPTHMKGARL